MPLDDSLQWQAFCDTVSLLQARRNRVFVVIGPFNEHMLNESSRQRYAALADSAAEWLREAGVPHLRPAVLPSELYADASHPLAKGYEILAEQLVNHPPFQGWIESKGTGPR